MSSQFHREELEEEGCHLWYCWKGMGSARSSPDSRWRWFLIVTAARKSGRSRIGAFLPDLFNVRYHCPWYLLNSSLEWSSCANLSISMHRAEVQLIPSCDSQYILVSKKNDREFLHDVFPGPSASLSLFTRSTDTGTQLWLNVGPFTSLHVLEFVLSRPNKTSFSISLVSKPGGCSLTGLSVLDNWVFDFWLDLLGVFTTSRNFWAQFFHPIIFEGNRRRRSRWRRYFLVYDFSSFHHDSLRDTISQECIVKDDCVRSCLIELKSFLLSKFDVDPIHSVFDVFSTFFACTMQDVVLPGQSHTDLCVLC